MRDSAVRVVRAMDVTGPWTFEVDAVVDEVLAYDQYETRGSRLGVKVWCLQSSRRNVRGKVKLLTPV